MVSLKSSIPRPTMTISIVGAVDDSGLFTPNLEGPNPARIKQENNFAIDNYGDVWVVADFKAPTAPN